MKRIFIALMAIIMATASLWAKDDDEVIITRQLTMSQRSSLPESTISLEVKGLTPNKKADRELVDAIQQVMDTISREDYQNRTFVLLLEAKSSGEISIAAHSDDIITHGKNDASIYHGTIQHERYHFVVLNSKNNQQLLEQLFKRRGKVKFVQEFEFVDFKTPNLPTNVIASWSRAKGLQWETVIINEDPNAERDIHDSPTHFNN